MGVTVSFVDRVTFLLIELFLLHVGLPLLKEEVTIVATPSFVQKTLEIVYLILGIYTLDIIMKQAVAIPTITTRVANPLETNFCSL